VQLPFYAFAPDTGSLRIAWDVLHCTIGDLGIAVDSFMLAAAATRDLAWPLRRPRAGLALASVAGLAWTFVSEWQAVYIRGAWAYAPAMPTLLGIGLLPVLQWMVIPPLVLTLARRRGRRP
jgi:hypothetical protein